jgi:DNA invertase Pin-like site-specific DNA recombinase
VAVPYDARFTENLLHNFKSMGVKVFIADMPSYNDDNRKDVLIRQIREAIAEENRKEIIERLKKGREERIRKGSPPGGNVAYGYVRNNSELKKNPHEVRIIKAIFNLADQGKHGQEIADYLNNQNFRRRNGKAWTQRQVWAILDRQDLYQKGIFKYGIVIGRNEKLIIL